MGLLRTVLTVGLIPLGAIVAYRLPRPTGSRYAQLACLLVYVADPPAVQRAGVGALGRARALRRRPDPASGCSRGPAGWPPFGTVGRRGRGAGATRGLGGPDPVARLRHRAARPPSCRSGSSWSSRMAVALAVGGLLALSADRRAAHARGRRSAAAGAGRRAPPAVEPRLRSAPGAPWAALAGPQQAPQPSDLGALLRFEVGPLGSAPIGWCFLVAAALPLLIGRAERHAWAVRGVDARPGRRFAIAWAAQRGTLAFALPPVEVLLVPAAAGLALAAAMGVAAFEVDLPGYRFGWRQIASGLAAARRGRRARPGPRRVVRRPLVDAGGRLRERAWASSTTRTTPTPFRVLWVGDPAALPLGGWPLDDGLAYGTTDEGAAGVENLWVGSDDGRTGLHRRRARPRPRPGRPLGSVGCSPRWASATSSCRRAWPRRRSPPKPLPVPPALLGARSPASSTSAPRRAGRPHRVPQRGVRARPWPRCPPTSTSPRRAASPARCGLDLSGLPPALPNDEGHLDWSGPVAGDTSVFLSASSSDRWALDGRRCVGEAVRAVRVGERVRRAEGRRRHPPVPHLARCATACCCWRSLAWLWVMRTLLPPTASSDGPTEVRRREGRRASPPLVILGGVLVGGLVLQAADEPAPDPASAAPPVVAGVAMPAAAPPGTLTSTWYCAGGTATDERRRRPRPAHRQPLRHRAHGDRHADRGRLRAARGHPRGRRDRRHHDDHRADDDHHDRAHHDHHAARTVAPTEVDLPAQSRVEVSLAELVDAPLAGAIIEVDGGQVAVEHQITSADDGKATAPCSTTAATSWSFPWGVTARGARELLVFMNPFPDDASLDVSFATDEGARDTLRFRNFVVPGRSVVGAYVDDPGVAQRKEQVSAQVHVRSGRLVVDRIQTFDGDDDDDREGITVGLGAPVPAETWIFPDGQDQRRGPEQIVVYNPSDAVAEVEVEVRLVDPETNPAPEPFEVTVLPGRFSIVDLPDPLAVEGEPPRVPLGVPHSSIVRSLNGVPITAERVTIASDGPTLGVSSTLGSPLMAPTWYFAGGGIIPDEREEVLTVFNGSTDGVTTFSVTAFADGRGAAAGRPAGPRDPGRRPDVGQAQRAHGARAAFADRGGRRPDRGRARPLPHRRARHRAIDRHPAGGGRGRPGPPQRLAPDLSYAPARCTPASWGLR